MSTLAHPNTAEDLLQLQALRHLPENDLAMLFSKAGLREFKAGETWSPQEPCFYMVWQGELRLGFLSPAGKQVSIRLMGPGDMVGIVSLFADIRNDHVHFLGDVSGVLLVLTRQDMDQMLAQSEAFRTTIIQAMARELVIMGDRIYELAALPARARLQAELVRMARRRGRQFGDHVYISPAPKHEGLATQIGVTREVVSRLMKELNESGLIASRRGEIVILDFERLQAAVSRDLGTSHN